MCTSGTKCKLVKLTAARTSRSIMLMGGSCQASMALICVRVRRMRAMQQSLYFFVGLYVHMVLQASYLPEFMLC